MTWRDKKQQGSFRGVSFSSTSQTTEGGRRVVVHEYAGSDEAWAEDLGQKADISNLELFVIGADYMAGRDALLVALKAKGSGELVHPWLGRMQVQVQTYSLSESSRQGGMATFTVAFVEAGKQQFPSATKNTASAVDAAANAAVISSADDFTKSFSVAKQPGWVVDDAIAGLNSATAAVNAATAAFPAMPAQVTGFYSALTTLQGSLNTLVRLPADLANGMVSIIGGMGNTFADPIPALQLLAKFGDNQSISTSSATPARKVQADNQAASIALTRRVALIEQARASSAAMPESSVAAIALRDRLADELDVASETANDDVYLALVDLRSAMVTDLTERAAQLPQIHIFNTQAVMPAVVLAHRLMGDASRVDELVARNGIRHPGFVPAGIALEVVA